MQTKLVKRLHNKKDRAETGLFLVEGEKSIVELLSSDFETVEIYISKDFFSAHEAAILKSGVKHYVVDAEEIASLSTLEHNHSALALVKQKMPAAVTDILSSEAGSGITLMLDGIRDPGNLGTLIRIADWYGLRGIIASPDTTELYNPKTIAASMGSFTRIPCAYADLSATIRSHCSGQPLLVAETDGTPADTLAFPESGILIIGSESHGISANVRPLATQTVAIRSYGKAESLNAAIAGAVILDHWKQQSSKQ